jgi:predicted dehydrogenase
LSWRARRKKKVFLSGDQFAPELIHFSKCLRAGKKPETDGHEGWADVRIMAAIARPARTWRAVKIAPVQPQSRVKPSQETKRPPLRRRSW